VWHPLNTEKLKPEEGAGEVTTKCCGMDIDEELIGCEARSSCQQGEFFNYTCAGIDPMSRPLGIVAKIAEIKT